MSSGHPQLQPLADTIRILSAEAVQKANAGHPGMPLGCADIAALLWSQHLSFQPEDGRWLGRDRFVLSAGHGSMLLYSLLHLFGFDLPLEQIQQFRQWDSKTPGHPEFGLSAGIETTTGPLGQGFANGVGMAISGKMMAERYDSSLFDYHVYAIVSDGDLMEGVSSEAASIAGHLELSNLIYIYDDNEISIGGSTDVCFTESVPTRFESAKWYVQEVDGHDFDQLNRAIENAKTEKKRPSIICATTTIGKGSPNKAGSADSHGSPLGDDEVALLKKGLGWSEDSSFHIPQEVKDFCHEVVERNKAEYEAWQEKFRSWSDNNKPQAQALSAQIERKVNTDFRSKLHEATKELDGKATRAISGAAIQVIAEEVPFFLGGSADLEPSTKTLIKAEGDLSASNFKNRNLRFGVREHSMGSIVNGLAYEQSWVPYSATFLVFADYMRPPIRLAALSHLQSFFLFTHDSFWVGEDGPTHQPIEHIETLRLIPNLYVFRPADCVEVAECYLKGLEIKNAPSAFLFTRQSLPSIDRPDGFEQTVISRGAYCVRDCGNSDCTIVATGSEVWLAIETASVLADKGVSARVVSMPCKELFLEQDESYQHSLLPAGEKVVTLEAGVTSGWRDIAGREGLCVGIDRYGASAPGKVLAEKFGFQPEIVGQKIESWLK